MERACKFSPPGKDDGPVKSRHPVGERGPGFLQRPGNTGFRPSRNGEKGRFL